MTYAVKPLFNAALSTTLTTALYTNPGSVTTVVTDIIICNTGTVARAVTMSVRGSGAGHRIFNALSVQPNETVHWEGHQVLLTTETLCGGQDNGTDVTATISGVEG